MTPWGWFLWLLLLALWLYVTPLRRGLSHAEALRHKLAQPKRDRYSIEAAKTDRVIREADHTLYPDRNFKHVNCPICGPGPLKQGMVPSTFKHPFFRETTRRRSDSYGAIWHENYMKPALAEYADTVSSRVMIDGKVTKLHTVMLDFDFPVTLIESTTTSHHHLYIDKLVTWRQYKRLLRGLVACGLIEEGYYKSSVARGATHLRPPWVKKPESSPKRKGGSIGVYMNPYWAKIMQRSKRMRRMYK